MFYLVKRWVLDMATCHNNYLPISRRDRPKAAHFPHLEDPEGLSDALREFIGETQPGRIDDADWGSVLERRSPPRRVGNAAA
jgi:hypothetical protein